MSELFLVMVKRRQGGRSQVEDVVLDEEEYTGNLGWGQVTRWR